MHRFEEEEHEPVAVVRTLSDFALALTLVVLMLIGTRSVAGGKRAAESRAVSAEAGKTNAEVSLVLVDRNKFTVQTDAAGEGGMSAVAVAERWIRVHPNAPATIVLQFQQKTLATDLHGALLDLQAAFGTNLGRIDTVPLR
jgi:hypothetical protein